MLLWYMVQHRTGHRESNGILISDQTAFMLFLCLSLGCALAISLSKYTSPLINLCFLIDPVELGCLVLDDLFFLEPELDFLLGVLDAVRAVADVAANILKHHQKSEEVIEIKRDIQWHSRRESCQGRIAMGWWRRGELNSGISSVWV